MEGNFPHKLNVRGYHRRGRQLLLAKVKYAGRQDWYISTVFESGCLYKYNGDKFGRVYLSYLDQVFLIPYTLHKLANPPALS